MELLVSDTSFNSGPRWLLFHAVAVFAFLYLPIAVLILYSFNGEGVGGFPPHHLTLDWYRTLFADGPIWDSVLNSLQVALAAMVIALMFGVPAALALERARQRLGEEKPPKPRQRSLPGTTCGCVSKPRNWFSWLTHFSAAGSPRRSDTARRVLQLEFRD